MEIDRRVRGYACAVVGDCAADQITAVSRFESGERHAVYKVSYLDAAGGGSDVVVRISASDVDDDRARAEREAAVLNKVQGVAAPLLYDFRRDSPWFDTPTMCMQFLSGQQRDLTTAAPEDVERLGGVVASVHGLAVDDLVEWFPEFTNTAAYLDGQLEVIARKLPAVRDPLPISVQGRLKRAVQWVHDSVASARSRESFAADDRLVLLHGDVAGGNILWGPQPVLIDWEYARLGDPADEVAYIFTQNGLTAAQRQAFWRGYRARATRQRPTDHVVDRVGWWEPVTLLGSALWWIERWSSRHHADAADQLDPSAPRTQAYYLDHAVRRLDRFDELTRPGRSA